MSIPVQTSSFRKRESQTVTNVAGTKISATNSTLTVSTGIPSLDAILDSGLPLGSLCLIEEDMYGPYAKIVAKYFLAEGVLKQNYIFCASMNESPWELLNNLPSPIQETKEASVTIPSKEELKIAWRYENLSMESNVQSTGVAFDLSTSYSLSHSQKGNILVFDDSEVSMRGEHGNFQSSCCFKLVEAVDSAITKWNLDSGSSPNLLRVVVSSYGSPFWQLEDGDDTSSTFTRALMLLKALVRSANAVAIVTIPHHLLNETMIGRGRSIADVVIRLKSLREDPYLQDLMDVHGILEMKKMINLTSLKPLLGQDGTTTFGFKATKRKFRIEKLHLPPAIEGEKSAESADIQSLTSGCGSGSSKSNLDF